MTLGKRLLNLVSMVYLLSQCTDVLMCKLFYITVKLLKSNFWKVSVLVDDNVIISLGARLFFCVNSTIYIQYV